MIILLSILLTISIAFNIMQARFGKLLQIRFSKLVTEAVKLQSDHDSLLKRNKMLEKVGEELRQQIVDINENYVRKQ